MDHRVEVQRAKNGATTISFRQIPLDELERFLEAVRAELLGGGGRSGGVLMGRS